MNILEKYLNERNYEQKDMLKDMNSLKKRVEEAEAIVHGGESPFKHLSLMKSLIQEMMDKISRGR